MVASTAFLAFGLLGGFAYLAHRKGKELLAYGLAGVAVASFLDGVRFLMGPGAASGFGTFFDILNHVSLGVGAAFLAYVAAIEGWKYHKVWRGKRREAEIAFQEKIAAQKQARSGDVAGSEEPAAPRGGKRVGA
jgi:hypothetical protein